MRAVALALVLLLTVAPLAPVAAETAPAFVVRGVEVDQTAATAAQAREAAMAEGQRKAFARMIARITLPDDSRRVPRLTQAQIAELVESFEVESERASAVRYLATMTFRFNAHGVRDLLRRADVPFAETFARPLVVLPVFIESGIPRLWDDPNPWLAAWRSLPPRDGLQPLLVPLGDLGDIGAIAADQAAAGAAAPLNAIAARYGAGGTVVAEARLQGTAGADQILEVAVARYDGVGDQTVVDTVAAAAGETEEALFLRAAAQTAAMLEERWKSEVLLRFSSPAALVAEVVFQDLSEWVALRRRLAETAIIRRADILSLGRGRARVELHYVGSDAGLRLALAQKDLSLVRDGQEWKLHRAGGATTGPATPRP